MSLRKLFNTKQRLPIRADFPDVGGMYDCDGFLSVVEEELKKQSVSVEEVKRINIAYVHKNPKFFGKGSLKVAQTLQKKMKERWSHLETILCDGIIERKYFNRSFNQSEACKRIVSQQAFSINPSLQTQPLPFITNDHAPREYFIVVDDVIGRGTTMAEFINYIEFNGGYVIGAFASGCGNSLTQKPDPLSDKFDARVMKFENDKCYFGKIPEIVFAFSQNAPFLSPDECFERLEKLMNRHKKSLFTLTNGEAELLIHYGYAAGENALKKLDRSLIWESIFSPEYSRFTAPIMRWYHRELHMGEVD